MFLAFYRAQYYDQRDMLKIVQMFGDTRTRNLMDGSPDQEMETKHLTVAMLSQRRTKARRWQAAEPATSEILFPNRTNPEESYQ
jgi:hypothetical protein